MRKISTTRLPRTPAVFVLTLTAAALIGYGLATGKWNGAVVVPLLIIAGALITAGCTAPTTRRDPQ